MKCVFFLCWRQPSRLNIKTARLGVTWSPYGLELDANEQLVQLCDEHAVRAVRICMLRPGWTLSALFPGPEVRRTLLLYT